MKFNCITIQIMWKEILIIFIIVYGISVVIGIYMLFGYKRILEDFYANNLKDLKKVKKLHKLFNFYSATYNKNMCSMYNQLCLILASLSLLEGDEVGFLKQINVIKREKDFELKFFVLILYYSSKKDIIMATRYYQKYLECTHNDNNIKIILNSLFANKEFLISDSFLSNATRDLKNPAIIKLFRLNGILIDDKNIYN